MNNYYIDDNFFRGENKVSIIIESVNNKSSINNVLKIGTCWFVLSTSNTKFNTLTPVLRANTMTILENDVNNNLIAANNDINYIKPKKKIKLHNDILPIRLSYISNKMSLKEIELLFNDGDIDNNKCNVYNKESAAILDMNLKSWNCIRQSMKIHFGNDILSNGIIFSFLLPNSKSIIEESVSLAAYKNTKREMYKEDIEFSSYRGERGEMGHGVRWDLAISQ